MNKTKRSGALPALFIAFSLGLYWITLRSAAEEFTSNQHMSLFLYCSAWIGIGGILLFLLKARLALIGFATFSTLALFTLFVFLTPDLAGSASWVLILYGLLSFTLFLWLGQNVQHQRLASIVGSTIAFFCFALILPWALPNRAINTSVNLPVTQSDLPDVLLLSFDSLIPSSLSETLIGVKHPNYEATLSSAGVRRFKNGFTAFAPTRPALNSILALDADMFAELDAEDRPLFFTGQREGLLSAQARSAGYTIHTWFDSAYLGAEQGPYIDDLRPGVAQNGPCNQIFAELSFFGRCHPRVSQIFDTKDDRLPAQQVSDAVNEFILSRSKLDPPALLMAHLYAPGHTQPSAHYLYPERKFMHNEKGQRNTFKEHFKDRSALAAKQMQAIFTAAENSERETIIMIYGDHGPYTSRRMPIDKKTGLPRDLELHKRMVADRYGTLIATWPGMACDTYLRPLQDAATTINIDVVRALMNCATGADVIMGHDKRTSFIELANGARINPEDFRYED